MLAFLNTLIGGFFNILNNVLPNSPFQGVVESSETLALGLAWLNWVFPVGDCLAIFAGVLVALVVWICVRLGLGKFSDISEKLV